MIEATIEKLKELFGADSDLALSRELGLERTAVAQWRKRGTVPRKFMKLLQQVLDELHQDNLQRDDRSKEYNARIAYRLYGAPDASNWVKIGLALLPADTLDFKGMSRHDRPGYLEACLLSIIGFAMQTSRSELGIENCTSRKDVQAIIELMQAPVWQAGISDIARGHHRRDK